MLFSQIKTPSNLKSFVEQSDNSFYFTRDTMKFFGDTMRNFGICRHTIVYKGVSQIVVELYRKAPTCKGSPNGTLSYWVVDPDRTHTCKRVFKHEIATIIDGDSV